MDESTEKNLHNPIFKGIVFQSAKNVLYHCNLFGCGDKKSLKFLYDLIYV